MLIECMEEGTIQWKDEINTEVENGWIDVGTVLGEITDENSDDGGEDEEWHWQAYLHDGNAE